MDYTEDFIIELLDGYDMEDTVENRELAVEMHEQELYDVTAEDLAEYQHGFYP